MIAIVASCWRSFRGGFSVHLCVLVFLVHERKVPLLAPYSGWSHKGQGGSLVCPARVGESTRRPGIQIRANPCAFLGVPSV